MKTEKRWKNDNHMGVITKGKHVGIAGFYYEYIEGPLFAA